MNSRTIWLIAYAIIAIVILICAITFFITDKPFKRRSSKNKLEAIAAAKAKKEKEEKEKQKQAEANK